MMGLLLANSCLYHLGTRFNFQIFLYSCFIDIELFVTSFTIFTSLTERSDAHFALWWRTLSYLSNFSFGVGNTLSLIYLWTFPRPIFIHFLAPLGSNLDLLPIPESYTVPSENFRAGWATLPINKNRFWFLGSIRSEPCGGSHPEVIRSPHISSLTSADLQVPAECESLPLPTLYRDIPHFRDKLEPSDLAVSPSTWHGPVCHIDVNDHVPPIFQPVIVRGPNNKPFRVMAFVDSGADHSFCNEQFLSLLGATSVSMSHSQQKLADSSIAPSFRTSHCITIWSKRFVTHTYLRVLSLPQETAPHILLGRDLMDAFQLRVLGLTPSFPDEIQEAEDAFPDFAREPRVFDHPSVTLPPLSEALRSQIRSRLTKLLEENDERVSEDSFISYPAARFQVLHAPNTPPSYVPQYKINPSSRAYHHITEKVNEWFRTGRTVLFNSAMQPGGIPHATYNMPLLCVLATNPDGSEKKARVCADARGVNVNIIDNKFPLPDIRALQTKMMGKKYFTELDLTSAFLQFPVDETTQYKLAFTWAGRTYCFAAAPFGLKPLSAHCQQIMMQLFADFDDFLNPYVDNLAIFSDTLEEHERHVALVIQRCTEWNVRLSLEKCKDKLVCTSIKTLGSVIAHGSLSADPDKIASASSWPQPTTGKELLSFLSFCSYMRHHVRHYADLSAPLHTLSAKYTSKQNSKQKIIWTDSTLEHFNLLRQAVATCPSLNAPRSDRPFAVCCDSSIYGVGACLYQPAFPGELPNEHNIISFASRGLQTFERRYSVYRLELSAVVFALRQFDDWLFGREFTLLTDHHSLIYLHSQRHLHRTLMNFYAAIAEYSFNIVHVPGYLNSVPDILSRRYSPASSWGCTPPETASLPFDHVVSHISTLSSVAVPAPEIVEQLESAPLVSRSVSFKPTVSTCVFRSKNKPASIPHLPIVESPCVGVDDVLMPQPRHDSSLLRSSDKPELHVLDSVEEQHALISAEHERGHFGSRAVYAALVRDGYFWPNMVKQIESVCSTCKICHRWNRATRNFFHPTRPVHALWPWDLMEIDFITSFDACDGFTTIMAVTDVFSSFTILRPLQDRTTASVAQELLEIFCTFGSPRIIRTDGDGTWIHRVLDYFLTVFNIEHQFILPYNSRALGKVERHIDTASQTLRKLMADHGKTWLELLPLAQLFMNRKHRVASIASPFATIFNRSPNNFSSVSASSSISPILPDAVPSDDDKQRWTQAQHSLLHDILPAMRQHIIANQDDYTFDFNSSHTVIPQRLKPDTHVMLRDVRRDSKNNPPFIGPFRIARSNPNNTYTLRDSANGIYHRDVTRDMLKVITALDQVDNDAVNDGAHYIDKIISHKQDSRNPNRNMFLVTFSDGSPQGWFHPEDLEDFDSLHREYRASLANKKTLPKAKSKLKKTPSLPVAPAVVQQSSASSLHDLFFAKK